MLAKSQTRLALAAIVAVVCQLFLTHVGAVESDEGMFAACAVRQIIDHAVPLAGCVDTKPPGVFVLYEAAYRLFGIYNPAGLRLIWLVFALALAGAVRALRRGTPAGDDSAALCLLLLTTSNYFLALKTELPVAALATGAIALAQRRNSAALFAAGLLFGAATLFKQPALLFVPVGVFAAHPDDWRRVGAWPRPLALLALGCALPIAATIGIYAQAGSVDLLTEQMWVRPSLYAMHKSAGYSAVGAAWTMLQGLIPQLCLVAMLAVSAWQRRGQTDGTAGRPVDRLAWCYLAAALVFVSLGGHFFRSYAVIVIAPLALLLTRRSLPRKLRDAGGVLAAGAAAAALATAVITVVMLRDANRADIALAQSINRAAAPDERLYVWGYVPELYPATGRVPASRYVGTTVLFGYFHDSAARLPRDAGMKFVLPGDWNAFLAGLDGQKFLFVDTSAVRMGAPGNFSADGFPQMRDWLRVHCVAGAPVAAFPVYRCAPTRGDTEH